MIKQVISKLTILTITVLLVLELNGQEKLLKGVVTTFDSIRLHGAVIKVSGTNETVYTDSLGRFSVRCNQTDKIKVSGRGFYNESLKIESKITFAAINLRLLPGDKNRELALGVISVTDHEKLNALASLNSKDIDYSQYRSVYEAISGRIPGVSIIGGDIIIRGNSSINGPTPALIIVDSTPVSFSSLNSMNPADIKSINVIKDGSSAIYGSKGANGVVVIETKSGKDK